MLILLERKTPRISTDSTLDHSHLATEVQLSENMQIGKNLCITYANPQDKNRYYTASRQLYCR